MDDSTRVAVKVSVRLWRYNIKPATDQTDRSQNGTQQGMDEEPSKEVCENVLKGLTLELPTYNYEHEMVLHVMFQTGTETISTSQLLLNTKWGPGQDIKELLWQRKQCCSTIIITELFTRRKKAAFRVRN